MSEDANLFAQQEANRRRSTWLVIGFILFFSWVGFGGDLAFGLLTADHPPGSYHHVIPFIGIFTTLAAIGGAIWMALFYTASAIWPENNPFLDDHLIELIILLAVAYVGAGRYLGLGYWWENTSLVRRYPFLR